MRKRDIILKTILYGLYLLLFYLLQTALFPRLAIGGIKPLILPVAVVGIALYEGSVPGALAGLAAGVWSSTDELSGIRRTQQVFSPQMAIQDRNRALHNWHAAVDLCRQWGARSQLG